MVFYRKDAKRKRGSLRPRQTNRAFCTASVFLREDAISWSVAQLGAREMLLRSLSPEYADGPLKLCRSTASVGERKDAKEARPLRPRQIDRASAKRVRCQRG